MLSHGGSYLGIRIVGWMGRNEWDGDRHGGRGRLGRRLGPTESLTGDSGF